MGSAHTTGTLLGAEPAQAVHPGHPSGTKTPG